MATVHPVPNEDGIRQMLGMLYGNDLVIADGQPVDAKDNKSLVAVYINDDDQPVTACVCDYNFVAFAASSLTRIPIGGAEDAAASGDFSEMMLGNIHEVMNVCSRLFMDANSPHLRLDTVYTTLEDAPEGVPEMIGACQGQVDCNIDIPNYGAGNISFLST